MKTTTTLISAVAGVALCVPQAQAQILSWDYTLEAGFDHVVPVIGVTGSGDSGDLNLPTKIEWGTPVTVNGNPSSLVLNPTANPLIPSDPNPLSGSINTTFSGDPSVTWEDGTVIAHNNFVIDGIDLDSAIIQDKFVLTGNGHSNTNQSPFFPINFQETLNFPNTAPFCPAPDPAGCKDIFVLDLLASAISTEIIEGSLALIIEQFQVDNYLYKVALRSNPDISFTQLAGLTNDQCAAAGVASGCVGALTVENGSNIMALQFAVIANKVPEPGILALFGIGLAGLGFSRRHNQKAMQLKAAEV